MKNQKEMLSDVRAWAKSNGQALKDASASLNGQKLYILVDRQSGRVTRTDSTLRGLHSEATMEGFC